MDIGIMGKMGSGKTIFMSAFATYYAHKLNLPIYANYGLKDSIRITSVNKLNDISNAIMCLDEIEKSIKVDSRQFKDNVPTTRFINQTRKKNLIIFYTSQHIRQVDLRLRNATDVLAVCEKNPGGTIKVTLIDYQYRTIAKKICINNPSAYWHLYDTMEFVEPLKKIDNHSY